MKYAMILGFMLSASAAWAGILVRNGGEALVCERANGTQNVWLLDYAEAALKDPHYQLDPQLETKGLDFLIERIAKFSPKRAAAFKVDFDIRFAYGNLTPTTDLGTLAAALPTKCSVHQAAVQTPDPLNPSLLKNVLLNHDLWAKMDQADQAGLYMHEILYRELLQWNVQNSATLRHFNAVLASTAMAQMTYEDFVSLLAATGFQTYEYEGLPMTFITDDNVTRMPTFYPSGRLHQGAIVDFTYVTSNGINAGFTLTGDVEFRDTDKLSLASVTLANDQIILVGTTITHGPAGAKLIFDENSNVVKMIMPNQN